MRSQRLTSLSHTFILASILFSFSSSLLTLIEGLRDHSKTRIGKLKGFQLNLSSLRVIQFELSSYILTCHIDYLSQLYNLLVAELI